MPIAVIFEFRGASSRAKRKKRQDDLEGRRKRLADWPVKGVLAHIAGPMPGGWRVIDVWQSRAPFNQFGKTLRPVLKKLGVQGSRPRISPFRDSSNPSSPSCVASARVAGPMSAPGCLVSPTIAEPCRDTIDCKLDPTQHLLVDAARSVLLQELDLDVVQRIQVREPVANRAIE
jgi:hypothetical protein